VSLLFHEIHPDLSLQFAVWHLTEAESDLEALSGIKSPPRLKTPTRRLEYLAVRTLAVTLGINPASIAYKSTGQPYLIDDPRTISITHTKGYAALLLSEKNGTGIDMEASSDRVRRVRHKYMHQDEEALMPSTAIDETTALLLYWCAKEAVFKAIPEEGVDFKQDIRVDLNAGAASFIPTGKSFILKTWSAPDYVLVVCY
jgi:phosphopantetheinyl transferase